MKRLVIILIAGIFLSSCNKWLEENPKEVVEELFYNTPEELKAAVNAIFLPLRGSGAQYANYIATLECQSDWMYGRGSWSPLSDYQGLNDVNITRVSGFWNAFYLAIRNANLVIFNAPHGSGSSQEEKNLYIAQARFLRAFIYFQLVRNWGAVPLRTENNMDENNLAKSSIESIYALILSDLSEAEQVLPSVPEADGLPSKWAAKILLADVFLQLARYDDAVVRVQEVMDQGGFSLVKVTSVHDIQYNIFGPDILHSSEEIFSFKYARLDGQSNYILWISNHPSTKLFTPQGTGAYAVNSDATNPNYVHWDTNDLRQKMWNKINVGNGPNTLVSSKYVDPAALDKNGGGNDQPVYRYPDALLIYAEASVRSSNTISEAAMEALNKVRRRSYGYDPSAPSIVDLKTRDFTQETFINRVIQERGYEFIYEGKRWLELKRTAKLNDLIQYGKGKTVVEKHLLWPIPLSELNYNSAIDPISDQNPGY
ncbi:Starch-binding associating with outer membrane [bacterium A37T11]|nr:Starch-binding associating with outer membrane [bacterium A37T11]